MIFIVELLKFCLGDIGSIVIYPTTDEDDKKKQKDFGSGDTIFGMFSIFRLFTWLYISFNSLKDMSTLKNLN